MYIITALRTEVTYFNVTVCEIEYEVTDVVVVVVAADVKKHSRDMNCWIHTRR